jgi:hypothetical protein
VNGLRCPGVRCEYLTPSALERDGRLLLGGFCLCRDSLVRADRLQRLRARARGRVSHLTGALPVPPPSAATPSTER